MIDFIIEWVQLHPIITLIFYVIPGLVNLIHFTTKCVYDFRHDRRNPTYPALTVGSIIKRLACVIVPLLNAFVFLAETMFDMMGRIFEYIFKIWDYPLIGKRK